MDMQKIAELAAAYSAAGLGDTWAGGFLTSLSETGDPPRGRGMTIATDLLAKGFPENWPNWDLASRALEIAEGHPNAEDADALRSIANRVRSGNSISDKQVALLRHLVETADRPRAVRPVTPDETAWFESLVEKVNATNHFYWEHRPGTRNRIERFFKDARVGRYKSEERAESISQDNWDFISKQFATHLRDWNAAGAIAGELREHGGDLCLVIGERTTKSGVIFVRVMKGETSYNAPFSDLKVAVRAPRRKKSVNL